jgi:hypothetical protein
MTLNYLGMKRVPIDRDEFHERVSGIYGIMLFDPKDIQQFNTNIFE